MLHNDGITVAFKHIGKNHLARTRGLYPGARRAFDVNTVMFQSAMIFAGR